MQKDLILYHCDKLPFYYLSYTIDGEKEISAHSQWQPKKIKTIIHIYTVYI